MEETLTFNKPEINLLPEDIIVDFQNRKIDLFVKNPDVAESQFGTERESSKDYEGRVIFELLQNAIDRAENSIVIKLTEDELIVANDGEPFSIYPGTESGVRSDFHGLCTIHNSPKKPGESIGNKGVGFKSVWNITGAVTIESVTPDGQLWGFQLFNPVREIYFDQKEILDILIATSNRVPSFYFPKYKKPNGDQLYVELEDGNKIAVKTIIRLKLNSPADAAQLSAQLGQLRKTELFFIRLLEKKPSPDFCIYTEESGHLVMLRPSADWQIVTLRNSSDYKAIGAELDAITADFRKQYDNLPQLPNVAVAFPPANHNGFDQVVYTYLPTTVGFGFNVLVHADFVLDNSRKVIPQNAYNTKLLEIAVKLFTDTLQNNTGLHDYPDFYKFLDNDRTSVGLLGRKHDQMIWSVLESGGRLKTLLRKVYNSRRQWEIESYQGLFEVIAGRTGRNAYELADAYLKRIKKIQLHFCDPDIRIVPLNHDLPAFLPSGEKNDANSLFFRSKNFTGRALPEYLLGGIPGLKVSSFEPINNETLKKNNIIQEFSNLGLLDALSKAQAADHGKELLPDIFAFAYAIAREKKSAMADNFFDTVVNREEKLLAGILVPVKGGQWQKAIRVFTQSNWEEWIDTGYFQLLDIDRCLQILKEKAIESNGGDLVYVLTFMGVWHNFLPLKWEIAGNRYNFQLPWRKTPKTYAIKLIICQSINFIEQLSAKKEVYGLLNVEPWFYADNVQDYFVPSEVFLFSGNDNRRIPFIPKENRNPELDDLYRVFEIKSIDETRDPFKLKRQLDVMQKDDPQTQPGHPDIYKALMLSLSRSEFSRVEKNIPVLFRDKKGFAYRKSEEVLFAPREYKRHKYVDQAIKFAFFDDEINRDLLSYTDVKIFRPDFNILYASENRTEDREIKTLLQENFLPVLIALAGEQAGSKLSREDIYDRWEQLIIYRDTHVRMAVRIKNRENILESTEIPGRNVLYRPVSNYQRERRYTVGELAHDLAVGDIEKNIYFSRFASPLAEGIFRNNGLNEAFAAYFDRSFLSHSELQPDFINDFLTEKGITSEELNYEASLIKARLLSADEWIVFLEILQELTGEKTLTKETWAETGLYKNQDLRFSDITAAIGSNAVYRNIVSRIDPTAQNIACLVCEQKKIQALYYLTHNKTMKLSVEQFEETIKINRRELDYFSFSPGRYFGLFVLREFPEAVIKMAELELTYGLSDITPARPGIRLINSTVNTTPASNPSVGEVSHEQEESDRNKQRLRGTGMELRLILDYLERRDPSETGRVLREIRAVMEKEARKINGGKMESYLIYISQLILKENCTDKEMEYALHVSRNIGDGLGYDVLIPETDGGVIQILKVEVKSASGGSNRIYFSDNERRRILELADDSAWRISLNGFCDVDFSMQVKNYVCRHNEQMKEMKLKNELFMIADHWIIQFEQ